MGPLDTLPGRVIGAKPAAVCRWIFTLLGAAPGDTLDDLFPGSGAVGRAWAAYTGGEPSFSAGLDASREARADASSSAADNGMALSCSSASDTSCKARADVSCPDPGDPSSLAAGNDTDPSGKALDDGCLFPLAAAR